MTNPNDSVQHDPCRNYGNGCSLTKRELFAAMAMKGLMSNDPRDLLECCGKAILGEYVARQAVDMANFLIAELNREKK